jgi:2-phosphoglycerate kinase
VLLVRNDTITTPFSSAAMARTFRLAGIPLESSLALATTVERALDAPGQGREIAVDELLGVAIGVLVDAGELEAMRRLRVRWWVRRRRQPFVVAVGGTSGVGKSTVSQAAAKALGIDTVLSTDMVRAVLRVTIHPDLMPSLSESSFSAQRMFRSNLEGNRLLIAFEQQSRIVAAATLGLIRRMLKEGQQVMINGVHIVPGLVPIPEDWSVFGYVLTVSDPAEHERRFRQRFDTFNRDADHALARIAAIRDLDDYIVSHSRAAGATVIESTAFEETVSALTGAMARDIDRAYNLEHTFEPAAR